MGSKTDTAGGKVAQAKGVDDKFSDLESKYSFQENLLADLNDALVSQQRQLDELKQELGVIKQHLIERLESDTKAEQYNMEDQKPPHY